MRLLPSAFAALVLATGCSATISEPGGASPAPTLTVPPLAQSAVDKMDLLFVVDNAPSMADKQAILAVAIPDLVARLANPRCLDALTGQPIPVEPTAPTAPCPSGSQREAPPVLDMHVGVISSSLGSFGASACPEMPPASCPSSPSTPNDDHAHLLSRTDTCSGGTVPTYQGFGFLAWDPEQKLSPPGIASLGAIGAMGPGSGIGLLGALHDIIAGVGADGCIVPSQNEAWYRFLVDPTPYDTIQLVNNEVHVSGIDQVILAERQRFLRPDSLLAIVVVSDETDASLKEYSAWPLWDDLQTHWPHPRQECLTKGPDDPCCTWCSGAAPKGCAPDPMCASSPSYTAQDEDTHLRTFGLISQKERYGVDVFYPPSRYVNALTSATVMDLEGKVVPNPIFTNLDPNHDAAPVRDPGLVFYAAITGVPWQLIARQDAMGNPDLVNGVSALDPTQIGGFKTAKELELTDAHGNLFWDDIAGDPEHYVPAKSPFMIESTTPRSGTDPITGIALFPTSTPNGAGNPLNDHERTIAMPPGDIEYACVFPIPSPIDEGSATGTSGDCSGNPTDNPLCAPNPNDAGKNTLQTLAKAYPGVKHLAIARGLGGQGIAASICPMQLSDPSVPSFGYRPAVGTIVDRMKQALHGECLPRALTPDAEGQVACVVLEGRASNSCVCDASAARAPVTPEDEPAVAAARTDPAAKGLDCFCEIDQVRGAALADCRSNPQPTSDGWCYLDASEDPTEAALTANCPKSEPREIRFVGQGAPAPGVTIFISCSGK